MRGLVVGRKAVFGCTRREIVMVSAESTGSNGSLESESMVVGGETSMKQVTAPGSVPASPDVAESGSARCRLPPFALLSPRCSFSLHISPWPCVSSRDHFLIVCFYLPSRFRTLRHLQRRRLPCDRPRYIVPASPISVHACADSAFDKDHFYKISKLKTVTYFMGLSKGYNNVHHGFTRVPSLGSHSRPR